MKAIILSAGQGRRLLPLTADRPKCLLDVLDDRSILDVQLSTLADQGIREVTVMVGFGADAVEASLRERPIAGLRTRTLYNPFYGMSDNLVTCWLARSEMVDDFILLNGDTLFEPAVLERLLTCPSAPLTLAINQKASYDEDDMKVSLGADSQLRAVGKTLDPEVVDGESIGLMLFRRSGASAFRGGLDTAVRGPDGLRAWYLSVVNRLAAELPVRTRTITGLWWGEVDSAEDLAEVGAGLRNLERKRPARAHAPAGLR